MKTILTINPAKKKAKKRSKKRKKATTKKRRTTTMPKKRKTAKKRPRRRVAKKPTSRRRRRRNPGLVSRARGILSIAGIRDAAVGALRQTGGALLTQFFAKRFTSGGGSNDPNWTYQNYLLGALGALSAGVAAEVVRPGVGKDFLKGGLTLIMYKAFVNEIAPQNEFLNTNFGETDLMEYDQGDTYFDQAGNAFMLGQDGLWRPVDEAHRMGATLSTPTQLGEPLITPSVLGESFVSPGTLGQAQDPYQRVLGSDPVQAYS